MTHRCLSQRSRSACEKACLKRDNSEISSDIGDGNLEARRDLRIGALNESRPICTIRPKNDLVPDIRETSVSRTVYQRGIDDDLSALITRPLNAAVNLVHASLEVIPHPFLD